MKDFKTKLLMKRLESFKGVKIYRKEDDLDPEKFYISVDASAPTIKVGDNGTVLVGPFDSPEDAQTAAGTDDVTVVQGDASAEVSDDSSPASDIDLDASDTDLAMSLVGEPEMSGSGEAEECSKTEKGNRMAKMKLNMKSLREEVRADIKKISEELEIDTTVSNSDSSTEGESGALNQAGEPANATQAASDAGSSTSLDTDASRGPDFDGSPDARTEELASNGGDLGSVQASEVLDANGGDLGTVDKSGAIDSNGGDLGTFENTSQLFPGTMIRVMDASNKKVDTGVVSKVSKTSVTLEGNVEYNASQYKFLRIA